MKKNLSVFLMACLWTLPAVRGQQPAAGEGPAVVAAYASLADEKLQRDFPAMCLDSDGTPWVIYVEWDGKADTLKLARRTATGLQDVGTLAGPGEFHQPAIACDGKGVLWAVWSELGRNNAWKLNARRIVGGSIATEVVTLEAVSGNAVFADAGTDRQGRVWVAWQSFRHALSDIYTRYYDPQSGQWSAEIRVTNHKGGNWEPRLAFGTSEDAWIAFDSSLNGNFDVYLARVGLDGKVGLTQLTKSLHYEARASITATPDGQGFWIAWENGRENWGQATREIGGSDAGINAEKRVDVVYFDATKGTITSASDVTPVLKSIRGAKSSPAVAAAAPRRNKGRKQGAGAQVVAALNLPHIMVDAASKPWLATRYFLGMNWKIALTKYDPEANAWTKPVMLPDSAFGQDRHCSSARDANGKLWLCWPSDRRTTKIVGHAGVFLAQLDTAAPRPVSPVVAGPRPATEHVARWADDTPRRPREDRHQWTIGGQTYRLYWGDFHRHTDISNCRTATDGCVQEAYRYALDVGTLDMLGTSDHTDVGKPYDPYEWWCTQKLVDIFYVPGFFNSFYAYEREQGWPWGHRNVIFGERGGPIVYIKRALYQMMPWNKTLPIGEGDKQISPQELWKLLRATGREMTIISHTGATTMGTDWDKYKPGHPDNTLENVIEIYQGARVSYEGLDAPQPRVGLAREPKGPKATPGPIGPPHDYGQYKKGVYQNALSDGYKLGVWADSDHISTGCSYGGVYVKDFTRSGILEGINARRTIAATDRIFIELSCNGHMLGEIFKTADNPALQVAVEGTAPLRAITVIRNEQVVHQFDAKHAKAFQATFRDESPVVGENRYYLRVEQQDGNMAWSTPVWVTFAKK